MRIDKKSKGKIYADYIERGSHKNAGTKWKAQAIGKNANENCGLKSNDGGKKIGRMAQKRARDWAGQDKVNKTEKLDWHSKRGQRKYDNFLSKSVSLTFPDAQAAASLKGSTHGRARFRNSIQLCGNIHWVSTQMIWDYRPFDRHWTTFHEDQ